VDLRPENNPSFTAMLFDLNSTHVFRESGEHFLFDSSSLAVVQIAPEVYEFIEIARATDARAAARETSCSDMVLPEPLG
jgi:hypothetical protein